MKAVGSVTTTLFLIRHAAHAVVDRVLVGRTPDVGLSIAGRRQAAHLAAHFAQERIAQVQSSPQLRARQTAAPLAQALSVKLEIVPAVDELDTGQWTGRSFEELEAEPRWQQWNAQRGVARVPGGESMGELQQRVVAHLRELAANSPGQNIAIVSHAEPIRATVLYCRGIPLDDFATVAIAPASVTRICFGKDRAIVIGENECLHMLEAA